MRFAKDLIRESEIEDRATAYIAWKAVAMNSRLTEVGTAESAFAARGWSRYLPTAPTYTKAGSPGGDVMVSTDDGFGGLRGALVAAISRKSIVARLLAAGAMEVPITTVTSRVQIGTVAADVVEEAALKPIGRMDFTVPAGLPNKATGEVVVSAEALRSTDQTMQRAISAALVSAVAARLDVALVAAFTAGTPGAGDVGALLDAVSDGAPQSPVVIGSYSTLLGLSNLLDLDALGIPLIPTPAASGKILVLDAAGLLIADGGVEVSRAQHATVDFGTGNVSLFQSNLEAIRAERFYKVAFRPDAIAWASTGSPA
jgi:hypothetical protein